MYISALYKKNHFHNSSGVFRIRVIISIQFLNSINYFYMQILSASNRASDKKYKYFCTCVHYKKVCLSIMAGIPSAVLEFSNCDVDIHNILRNYFLVVR